MMNTPTAPILDVEIHQHERSLEFARRGNDQPKMLAALGQLGQTYLKDGDAPKALTQFEEAIKVAEALEDLEAQGRLWGAKGMALKNIGNFQLARAAFNKSLQCGRQLEHQTLICDAQIRIGMLQAETGEVAKGISKLEQAYAIAVEQEDPPRIVNIAMVLGKYFFQLEATPKAMEYYLDALHTARTRGDKPAECTILIATGNIQMQGEEYEGALESFEKALNIAGAIEDAGGQIGALVGLMTANAFMDKISLAQIYGEQAIGLANRANNRDAEMSVTENLIGLLLGQDQFKVALPHLERGLALAAESQNGDRKLSLLTSQAYAYYQLEDTEKAGQLYQTLLEEAVRLHNQTAEATALGRLSALAAEAGDLDQALDHAERALRVAHETENPRLVAEQQLLAALAQRDLGDEDKAELYFGDAIEAFKALGEEGLVDQAEKLRAAT